MRESAKSRDTNYEISKFVFIKFSSGLMSVSRFQNEMKAFETKLYYCSLR